MNRHLSATSDNALSSQLELAFDDNRLAAQLYGDFDQNLALIEQRLKVTATPRGNHLLLKGAWRPDLRTEYLAAFRALLTGYRTGIDWEGADEFERRCARLLPGLFLARVDGKSPVEYLTDEPAKESVRRAARALLAEPLKRLGEIADFWERSR